MRKAFPAVQALLERFHASMLASLQQKLAEGLWRAANCWHRRHSRSTEHVFSITERNPGVYVGFFFLRDGERLVGLLVRARCHRRCERERLLFSKFVSVTRATIKGSLVIAAIQGTLGGLIFGAKFPGAFLGRRMVVVVDSGSRICAFYLDACGAVSLYWRMGFRCGTGRVRLWRDCHGRQTYYARFWWGVTPNCLIIRAAPNAGRSELVLA